MSFHIILVSVSLSYHLATNDAFSYYLIYKRIVEENIFSFYYTNLSLSSVNQQNFQNVPLDCEGLVADLADWILNYFGSEHADANSKQQRTSP